jgi:chromosome segregation ATPase
LDLFGKKAAEFQGKLDEVRTELEKCQKELASARSRCDAAAAARRAAEEEAERLRTRAADAERERDQVREAAKAVEKRAMQLEERKNDARGEVEKAIRERDDAMARSRAAESETEGLRREVERLKADLSRAEEKAARLAERPARPPRPEPEPRPAPAPDPSEANVRIDALRRELAEQSERLRIAMRKAEHNRRAYLVTQMQLDMAEDRIHLLTKGTPRPVHVDRDLDGDEGPVEAEDVEGYEDEPRPATGAEGGSPGEAGG